MTTRPHLLDPRTISIPSERQRKEIGDDELDELFVSFSQIADGRPLHIGQIVPIVVRWDDAALVPGPVLVAGERRLRMMLRAEADLIKVTWRDELDEVSLQVIEFEENAKRRDLSWQDACTAVLKYHELQSSRTPSWTLDDTSSGLCLGSGGRVSRMIQVARELVANNEKIISQPNLTAAYGVIERQRSRAINNELSQLTSIEAGVDLLMQNMDPAAAPSPSTISTTLSTETPAQTTAPLPSLFPTSIEVADFREWAPSFSGRRFNFLHCDFPYGIGHHDTEQGGSISWGSFEDKPDTYWELCETLAVNLDRILFPSAHVVFWFSMKYYTETIEFFRKRTDLVVQDFPIYWHKTDGRGIAPDVKRQPQRIVETALVMSRGDRHLVRPKNNCYGAPSAKRLHISEKSEPMLRHFFEMFVDELSEVLDPTCGSGGALRAAESLGAKRVLGLEFDPEYAEVAATELRIARNKRALS